MNKEEVYETLRNLGTSIARITWDRGNGKLDELVYFDGEFDSEQNPKMYFANGRAQLDIKKMGGYSSIISIEEECPDGYCIKRTA